MSILLNIAGDIFEFEITHYEPEIPARLSGPPDLWCEGCAEEIEWQITGRSRAEIEVFEALCDGFNLYDEIEKRLSEEIKIQGLEDFEC